MSITCKNIEFCSKLKQGIDADKFNLPVGYNPIAIIRNAAFLWVPAPFHASILWSKLRCLNAAQLLSLSDMTSIDVREEKDKNKKLTKDDMIDIWNKQEAIVKASLIAPTFEEIINIIYPDLEERKKEVERSKEDLYKIKKKDKKYRETEQRILAQELFLAFPLPTNFMAFISAWAQGVDITDIKRLSRKMLLEAAILAANGKDNPHDHIKGIFTDKHEIDIDKAAWHIYNEFQEDQKNANDIKKQKYKWTGKGNTA